MDVKRWKLKIEEYAGEYNKTRNCVNAAILIFYYLDRFDLLQ